MLRREFAYNTILQNLGATEDEVAELLAEEEKYEEDLENVNTEEEIAYLLEVEEGITRAKSEEWFPCPSCGDREVANPANMCATCYLAGHSVPTDTARVLCNWCGGVIHGERVEIHSPRYLPEEETLVVHKGQCSVEALTHGWETA